ncbi:MAG: DeoR/GlpR family DNA-binding transcription regulator [Ancrocorticia sp.]|jgi:DeoR family fructose operon transcriptional repressor|nr:DeoR/GlpR family DNA-binding transcription regulator [Ancrocorticia sp.]MCI1896513.1 DeoR/GlpR family DNA-binding transcription regulator [Ancrocorticia sp.]MCI1933182.1 DeoR/GlpR family DNA-binding transcription regulator [Ancrocorticia sp.]MCI1963835.1 DeoR/GlpR family DNA-binding transcription regulator [Ancrocorticia sp.]MCI2002173.1 DeoR/GlpR family DNA-binding transcription regulator [Ancrocorticia sp.]
MYAEQRYKLIVDRLNETGRVSVTELAQRFKVTPETIRRDLDHLAEQSLLQRVHGGAVARRTVVVEPDTGERAQTNRAQKNRIAQACAAYLARRGTGSLFVDAGSTTSLVVPLLPVSFGPVVTNDPAIAGTAAKAGFSTRILPGNIRHVTLAAVGAETVAAVEQLHTDVAILGTNGMDKEGFTTPDIEEAAVKSAFVTMAAFRIVVADSSKAGVTTLRTFAALSDVDVLITDSGLPTHFADIAKKNGIEVVYA